MDEEVSDRVIEQRLRNRVIDAVEVLARGNEGLVEVNYNRVLFSVVDLDATVGEVDTEPFPVFGDVGERVRRSPLRLPRQSEPSRCV